MTIKINKFVETGKEKEELIIQANDGDKLFKIFLDMEYSPQSNEELAKKYNFNKRQASYYSLGLMAMGLVEIYLYHSIKLVGLNSKGKKIIKDINKKEFAEFLDVTNFIRRQKILLEKSSLSEDTKSRRFKSINSLNKWIDRNKNGK